MKIALRELEAGDNVTRLSLGDAEFRPLKTFLQKKAKQYHKENITKTYVLVEDGGRAVLGYVSLVCSQVELTSAALIDNYPYKEYPSIKIVRLAIDKSLSGNKLGSVLVNWSVSVSKEIIMPKVGCRFLVVDSKKSAVQFYEKSGFTLLDTPANKAAQHPLLYIDLHKI